MNFVVNSSSSFQFGRVDAINNEGRQTESALKTAHTGRLVWRKPTELSYIPCRTEPHDVIKMEPGHD